MIFLLQGVGGFSNISEDIYIYAHKEALHIVFNDKEQFLQNNSINIIELLF